MKSIFLAFSFAVMLSAQPKGPQPPPLLPCGVHGDAEAICGTRSPEDLEVTPDGKFLIVPQFVNGPGGAGLGMQLFNISAKTFSKLTVENAPDKSWGDPACPGPIGDALRAHGISLAQRKGGAWELYIVNHGGRQSIEMFELKRAAPAWTLAWHGCVVTPKEFNDVAALPDGSFIATHPTSMREQGDTSDLFAAKATGWVSRWTAGKGEQEIPGTRIGYPNGILASKDGRFIYVNAWTAKEVHKYDLKTGKEVGMVKLDFMPDNVTWTEKHQILAAGVKGARGDCGGSPCIQGFGVALIDPAKMTAKTEFDSQGKGALIGGVSVALQVGPSIYIGAFQGDRIVKIPWKN